ncbi:conjugal transfer protein TrbE [Burkholderia gladioli]|uniref:VirB4 family type IV secretion/conjugal transfer ATPase n=1 Tax=Burkholderia gladioli TaxID=28095 RepID=UPI0028572D8D|nr:conjugal transfer protein TrbE [Burkholderia gladioli]MDR8093097.1 conjugal transfer protein TrbE [Burkholderia gladioli]
MIEALLCTMSILGIALTVLLYVRLNAVDAHLRLKKHRSKEEGLSDLLIHAAVVDDGVIVGKNGSLMAAWLYKGDDAGSSTDEERNQVAATINRALVGMGNGWMIHVDAVRREAASYPSPDLSKFPDPITRAIDEERRQLFERLGTMYEGYFVLVLTYFPPMLAQRRFVEMMFDDDAAKPSQKQRSRNLLNEFKRNIDQFQLRMSAAVTMERLNGVKMVSESGTELTHDNFLRWLQFCITGRNHPVVLPSDPMYLDRVIGGQSFEPGVVPKIGRNFIQTVTIEGFPLEHSPGVLNALAEIACTYRWSNRFIFMDQHQAIAEFEKFRKKWRQKIRGFFDQVFNTNTGSIDQDAVMMVADAEAALAETKSGLVAQGFYTSVVVLMSEDRNQVEQDALKLEKAINDLGFGARIEDVNTTDAFLGTIPGHAVENVTRPLINTMNLAYFIPTSTIWTGEEKAPSPYYPTNSPAVMHCVTHGATPFRLNFHVRDLGHGLIFGPTRAGKSTLISLAAAQLFRYDDFSLFVFEKGMSMYPLVKAVHASTSGKHGVHYNVASDDDSLSFCPLQYLETRGDRAWAMDWIATILELNRVVVDADRLNAIADAVLTMHNDGARTLSDFVNTVQDETIRDTLAQYLADGNMGHLLDADHDSLSLNKFTVFEVEQLMALDRKYSLPVLLYLFRRIERSLRGQPGAIILDEAWLMLAHEVFEGKIGEWLRTMAKANVSIILATQSLADAAKSSIFGIIVESTATKIFLPNVFAREEANRKLYQSMGLNARQIEIIASATAKRQYYYVSEKGRRLFELALDECPMTLSLIGRTDKDSISAIKALEARLGYGWINEWMRLDGVNMAEYGVAA